MVLRKRHQKNFQKKTRRDFKVSCKENATWWSVSKKQLSKLKIYTGENHPHTSQSPETIDISKLNNKNVLRK